MRANYFNIKIQKEEEWMNYNNIIKIIGMSGSAVKLYLYFCTYENKNIIRFSPSFIHQEINLAKNSIQSALAELIKNNYIKKTDGMEYIFCPSGQFLV